MDYKIGPKEWNINGAACKPGDRLIFDPGTRSEIQFTGIRGTKENPVVITATDKVMIKRAGTGGRVVHFFNCDHFIFDGTDKKLIEITGGAHGVTLHDGSNHAQIRNLHLHHIGYSGVDITNYPTCDPKTWRGNYVMEDIVVADCLITDLTDGEGIYIGPSHYQSSFPLNNCPSGVKSALEHEVRNTRVLNNKIYRVGADGIQVGGDIAGAIISGNDVQDYGRKKVYGQNSGIQANPGTLATIENNTILRGTGFGVILQGRMGTTVRRNLIVGSIGGIMAVARENDAGVFTIENNTFQDITGNGVEYYSNAVFRNNVLQMRTGTLYKKFGGSLEDFNNKSIVGDISALKLDGNAVPMADSPIPAGVGWKDYVAPKPVITKETGGVELVTENGIESWYLTMPSGKVKKIT